MVIFLVVTPLIVYYALGYRLISLISKAEAIGVIIVETIPRKCDVVINGKVVGKSPQSVTNLLPGRTSVKIAKEGYQTWEKNIAVSPSKVTEIRDVRLWPNKIEPIMLLKDVDSFSLSPDRGLIAAITKDSRLLIVDDEGVELFTAVKLTDKISSLLWSPDSGALLAKGAKQGWLVDVSGVQLSVTSVSAAASWRQYAWDQRIPGRIFTINNQGDLEVMRVGSQAPEKIATDIVSFAVSSRRILAVDANSEIKIFNLQGLLIDTLKLENGAKIERIAVTPGGEMAVELIDGSLGVLSANDQLVKVADHVLKYGWSPDGQIIFAQTDDAALHIFNVSDERLMHIPVGQLRLVVRLSRPIRDAQWYAGGRHLIYQVDDEIVITEIDTRDHPVSYTVDATNFGDSLATVGAKGDSIFYLKNDGKTVALMKTSLVVE